MSSIWDKLDSGLSSIYSNYLLVQEEGARLEARVHPVVASGLKLHVLLSHTGDLTSAEAAGFETVWNDGHRRATGSIRLEDLNTIAGQPEVLKISYGEEPLPLLDRSVPAIRANLVWEVAGAKGTGVAIGIIDSGIDFQHEFFLGDPEPGSTEEKTRIRRIWDQGLPSGVAGASPPLERLMPGAQGTYGVEYKDEDINAALRDDHPERLVRHRDCTGHGTHVASIAAGRDATFRGIAPNADLIVVKFIDLENAPTVHGNALVNELQRLRDAVRYITNVARLLGKPVVINMSFGDHLGPHDGLTESEDWLDQQFQETAGKICVAAAGNSAAGRQHAEIVFSQAGDIEIPFELYDDTHGTPEFRRCVMTRAVQELRLEFYHPAHVIVTGELMPPLETAYRVGDAGNFTGRHFRMAASEANQDMRSGQTVLRRQFVVRITPHAQMGHLTGTYKIRLTATPPISGNPVTVHVWCSQLRDYGLRIGANLPVQVNPQDPQVNPEDRFLIEWPGGARNVITVAACDSAPPQELALKSSRGPLARHGGFFASGAPIPDPPDKPDLAAPGVSIHAARSRHQRPLPLHPWSLNGTSCAAPHVTGTVALMLEKNRNLTPSWALRILRDSIQGGAVDKDEFGAGRLDAKAAFDTTERP